MYLNSGKAHVNAKKWDYQNEISPSTSSSPKRKKDAWEQKKFLGKFKKLNRISGSFLEQSTSESEQSTMSVKGTKPVQNIDP